MKSAILSNSLPLSKKSLSLFTNGTLIDKLDFEKIPKNVKFLISLDGCENMHDKIRGKGVFRTVMNNIKLLISKGYNISCNYTLMKINKDCIKDTVKILHDVGVHIIQFSKLLPLGRGVNIKNLILSPAEYMKCLKEIDSLSKLYKDIIFVYDGTSLLRGNKKISWRYCSGGTTRVEIEPNGDVYPCALVKIPSLKFGNILLEPLEKIWEKRKLSVFFEEFTPRECKSCKYYAYCFAGCRAISYLFYGDFQHGDYFCLNKLKIANQSIST